MKLGIITGYLHLNSHILKESKGAKLYVSTEGILKVYVSPEASKQLLKKPREAKSYKEDSGVFP